MAAPPYLITQRVPEKREMYVERLDQQRATLKPGL